MASNRPQDRGVIDPDFEVSSEVFGGLIGLSKVHVNRLAKEGILSRTARGRLHLRAALASYIDYVREQEHRKAGAEPPKMDRLKEARAAEVERRMAIQDRELISLSESIAIVERMAGAFVVALTGIPQRITRNPRERKRIETILDQVRARLADDYAKWGKALAEGGSPDPAEGEDPSA